MTVGKQNLYCVNGREYIVADTMGEAINLYEKFYKESENTMTCSHIAYIKPVIVGKL